MRYSEWLENVCSTFSDDERHVAALKSITTSERTAWKIIEYLSDRRVIGSECGQCDAEMKDEIFEAIARIVAEEAR